MSSSSGPGRIILLTTTHRVAPGLLSWPAWQELRAAGLVLCRESSHPQLPYLKDAGVQVDIGEPEPAGLVSACEGGHTAIVLAAAEGEPRLTEGLARLAGSGRQRMPALELLPGSYDLPGARLLDLVRVMDRIRQACPWASTRTSAQIAGYGLEEMYELVEAVEAGDRAELREELGDVLLQVVFHARIAEDDEEEPFSVDDVAATLVAKLIHRHPHVFGDEHAQTPEDVKALWERTKAVEKRRRTSVTDGVPLGQPGLALAAKLAGRARAGGLTVPLPAPSSVVEDAAVFLGQRLLRIAADADAAGVDPEASLRAAARVYRDAIRAAEERG